MAKVSRYPGESPGGRWDTVGGRGNCKGGPLGTQGADGPGRSPPSLFVQARAQNFVISSAHPELLIITEGILNCLAALLKIMDCPQ